MVDEEQTVIIMVCAFIALGIIITAGYFILKSSGVSSAISIPDDQIKQVVSDDQYPDFMKFMTKQSIIYWLIGIVVGGGAIIALYIMLKENIESLS